MSRACSRAAPAAPSFGISRVFARPGCGAFAKTRIAVSITVAPRKIFRMSAQKIQQPQPPHEHDGTQHAAALPAPAGGRDALAQTGGPRAPLHRLAEGDVLHEGDLRK